MMASMRVIVAHWYLETDGSFRRFHTRRACGARPDRRWLGLVDQVEHLTELEDQAATASQGCDVVEPARVVVDQEEPRVGLSEYPEPEVGRPQVGAVVVLDQLGIRVVVEGP